MENKEQEVFAISTKYAQYSNYSDDNLSFITKDKDIQLDPSQINLTQEINSQYIPFEMPRYFDGIDLMDMTISIHFVNRNNKELYSNIVNVSYSDTTIRFGWIIDEYVTNIDGDITFEIIAVGTIEDNKKYVWKTKPNGKINILKSLDGNGVIKPSYNWYTTLINMMDAKLNDKLSEIDKKITDKIDNLPSWAKQPAPDKTLTQEGRAADAKAVGNELEKKADKHNPVFTGSISAGRKADTLVGVNSVAIGAHLVASGKYSIAEGYMTEASGNQSHAEGHTTIAASTCQHVQGRYNMSDSLNKYVHIIGNGTNTARSNAHTVDWKGKAWYRGSVTSTGADYAEFFEWEDGNLDNEDRVGLLATLDGEKIKLANTGDEILGIISGTAAVLGDNYECEWNGKYLTDDFGRILYDMVEEFIDEVAGIDEETGEPITEKQPIGFFKHPRLNPDYNPEQEYINRADRPEWATVGMIGKLYLRDDGTCVVNGYAAAGENGIATASTEKTNMRVLSRVNENVVRVLLK